MCSHLNRLIEAILKVHTIYHFQYRKENHPKIIPTLQPRDFSKDLKNEFETAVVHEPSVFEPLKFYCTGAARCLCSKDGSSYNRTWVLFNSSGLVKVLQIVKERCRHD